MNSPNLVCTFLPKLLSCSKRDVSDIEASADGSNKALT